MPASAPRVPPTVFSLVVRVVVPVLVLCSLTLFVGGCSACWVRGWVGVCLVGFGVGGFLVLCVSVMVLCVSLCGGPGTAGNRLVRGVVRQGR